MPLIQVNGESRTVGEGETLEALVESMGFANKPVVCEVNLTIVSRSDWNRIVLAGGDRVEIIGFVGGGSFQKFSRTD